MLFKSISNNLWELLEFSTLKQRISQLNIPGWYSTRSQTLQNALNYTLGHYNYGKFFRTLQGIYSLITNQDIKIKPYYITITSTEGADYTVDKLINTLRMHYFRTNNETENPPVTIHLCHIPKGKSYLKKALDNEIEETHRLKNLENLINTDPYTLCRIYNNFPQYPEKDIVIFTEKPTKHMLYVLFLMLPNIFNLTPREITEEDKVLLSPEVIQEITDRNTTITEYRALCAHLWEDYTNNTIKEAGDYLNDKDFTPEEYGAYENQIKVHLKALIEAFKWTRANVNTFIKELANAKNAKLKCAYNDKLCSVQYDIENAERTLERAYTEKQNILRILATQNNVLASDLQVFMDLLTNSKALEILDATDRELLLRVTAPLQYFTASDFERYEANERSNYNALYRDKPELKELLHKVFITQDYQIIMQNIISMRVNTTTYEAAALSFQAYGNSKHNLLSEFPNPHLYHHNCWGQAQRKINEHIAKEDYELAVAQMIAAIQTINIAEAATFINYFIEDLLQSKYTNLLHLVDKSGKRYTLKEALDHEKELKTTVALKEAEEKLNNAEGYTQIELPDDGLDWDAVNIGVITNETDNN